MEPKKPLRRSVNVYPLPRDAIEYSVEMQSTCAIVIDVLRSTTTLTYAAAAGLKHIIPTHTVEDAIKLKEYYQQKQPDKEIILSGERNCVRIDKFDTGNSPFDMVPEVVKDKTMIFTSTNGAAAMLAAKPAKEVLLASFVNVDFLLHKIDSYENISIICAGTDGKETEEDSLLAGYIVACLKEGIPIWSVNFFAERDRRFWVKESGARSLETNLMNSSGAKRLIELGYQNDIYAAAKQNSINAIPSINFKKIDYSILKKNNNPQPKNKPKKH